MSDIMQINLLTLQVTNLDLPSKISETSEFEIFLELAFGCFKDKYN
jgi:hypothetical protein